MAELSERDIEVLDFERSWWKHAGVKEQAIKDRFEMSATRYYQLLNELLERPEALAHDPILSSAPAGGSPSGRRIHARPPVKEGGP
jgi:hypothetical protein